MTARTDKTVIETTEVRILLNMLAVHAVVSVGLICAWSVWHLYHYLFKGK
jgi:hypothetical protein